MHGVVALKLSRKQSPGSSRPSMQPRAQRSRRWYWQMQADVSALRSERDVLICLQLQQPLVILSSNRTWFLVPL